MTVFMVVGFVTLLDSLVSVAPAVIMMASQQAAGDFDMQISFRSKHEAMQMGNTNFYQQDVDQLNQYYLSTGDWELRNQAKNSKFEIPLVNFTDINLKLKRDEKNFDGAFPRWGAISKAVNPQNRNKQSIAYAMIGVNCFYI